MEGIDKITGRIASDARAEGAAMMEKATLEARELANKMVAEADAEMARLSAEGDRAAEARGERLKGMAEMEARKRLLAAKQEMISKAFDGAVENLKNLPEADMVKLISSLVVQASSSGKEQIVLSMADHTRFGKKVAEAANAALKAAGREASLTLSASPRPLEGGGFMLSDGEVEINGTFAALVAELRADLTSPVAKLLFE